MFKSKATESHYLKICSKKRQLWLASFFPVFTIVALGIDSVYFYAAYFDGRLLTNVLCIVYFLLLFASSKNHLRKLMLVMLPLSYLGELLVCKVLGLYEYRTSPIPFYVPFGHAIVYSSGYILASSSWALRHKKIFGKIFTAGFCMLFAFSLLVLGDVLTVILGCLFFMVLKRKRWDNLYYFIALCVIFIELAGTFFKCWAWAPMAFGCIPTANPPMGAVFIYAGGDMLLAKIVSYIGKQNPTA